MNEGHYRIQAVSKMTGISTATLRSWERRYGVPSPARTQSAYRLYSDEDVVLLQRMRDLSREGMSPAQAAEVVRSTLPRPSGAAGGEDPFLQAQARLIQAAHRLDSAAIDHEIGRALLLGTGAVVLERVLVPVLRETGQLWHDGVISVAHEHLLTEHVTRFAREDA